MLANEAICVGQLLSRPDWKEVLDSVFSIRNEAISADKDKAFDVFSAFEKPIREAQRKYSTQIVLEQDKEPLNIEEYTFEMFRMIGALTESTIQPFIKELYCLATIRSGVPESPSDILGSDFGNVVNQLEKLLSSPAVIAPPPWGIRINQWRNIAQHHSYEVREGAIVVRYGKASSQRQIKLTRNELFVLAKELVRRLGALKSSRELTIANHEDNFRRILPETPRNDYTAATELGAAFATQGFKLTELDIKENNVVAHIRDVAPTSGPYRAEHCSQFVLPVGNRFPGRDVIVLFESQGHEERWQFSIDAATLGSIARKNNSLSLLAEAVRWERNP